LKICFVVDGRSPIARNWMTYFIQPQHEVHVISSYPCSSDALTGATLYEAPVAFAGFSGASRARYNEFSGIKGNRPSALASIRGKAVARLSLAAQHWLLPFDLRGQAQRVKELIEQISPDIVHAMRIPFEGILVAKAAASRVPLLISVWGNDFTLWAAKNSLIARQTRQALQRADALHCDCRRDLDLAKRTWGFDSKKPATVLPGAGGVQASLFHPGEPDASLRRELNISEHAPVIFNPRGFRGYVRNDVFFKAIPQILRKYPKAIFICSAMEGNPIAQRWVRRLAIEDSVRLLPSVPREQMADFFRLASISVSPSLHDGTPNTLLEAMACGCFPVAGDIESVREWITEGVNGFLCDPTEPELLAGAIIQALGDAGIRDRAREQNIRLIAERAEYGKVMQQAEEFYSEIIQRRNRAAIEGESSLRRSN
jgi:glycosyltransferase involved in cell wall biosynthesis